MKCPSCQREAAPGLRFCGECGTRLSHACPACAAACEPGQKYCGQCGTALQQGAAASHPEAERRQLTVMFCDLVGSTALSQMIDPEALRTLMQAYQQACGAVIERYDGHVAQYLGDGLMVYFGWPRAHEDDAERAVRTGLEIVAGVKKVPAPHPLEVRIGIATGPVVVGETGAGDASVPKLAVGETPNLAARLQGLASPGQLVIGTTTRRLLGAGFEYQDLGEHVLKGIREPMKAWRVLGASRIQGRFEASQGNERPAPLVGRDSELTLLLDRWGQAKGGEGQIVLLSGEPGIGKSRTTQALRERISLESHVRLSYQCSPYHTGSALYPVIHQLEHAAGFDREDTAEEKLDKLEAALAVDTAELPAVAPLMAALLGLPVARYPAQVLSPQKQKELTIVALAGQALTLSRRQPLLMIVEDAHWIDPTTLETLGLMVDGIHDSAILLVVTYRPEFVPPWVGRSHVTTFNLNRLSRRHGAAIVERVAAGKDLPEEVLHQILAKTDGVPLFVEELTRTVLEAGFLKEKDGRYVIDGPLPSLAIPSTLRDSLMARLDRLNQVKEVAQIGACVGREFSHEILSAVAPLPEAQLEHALRQLVESGLVFRRGATPDTNYTFKHALVQDSAYDSLLNARRQEIHGQIARAIEARFPETAKSSPELLALHYTKAGMVDDALPRWIAAVQLAAVGTRYHEALRHAANGFAIMDRVSPGLRGNLEVALCVTAGFCHVSLAGYASEQAATLFARVEAGLDKVTDEDVLASALWGIGVHAWTSGDFPKALRTYERLAALADGADDTDRRVFAYFCLGTLLTHVSQFDRARHLLEFVIENYEPSRHQRFIYAVGQDVKAAACAWLSNVELWTGKFDLARNYGRMAIEHASALNHPFSLSLVLSIAAFSFNESGNHEEGMQLAVQCIELCEMQRIPFWKGWSIVTEGVAIQLQGHHARSAERLGEGIDFLRVTGARSGEGYIRAWRAIALAHDGRFDEARREANEGCGRADVTGERVFLPATLYAHGLTDLLDPEADDANAEQWFQRSMAEADSQGHRLMELRAANSLAKLWQRRGEGRRAYELLAPKYGWFTEGFDTRDLKEAKALLDDLQSSKDSGASPKKRPP